MHLPYKYPAIQVKLVAGGEHISSIVHDALEFSKEMKVKVIVETCRGDLFVAPTNTREEILEQWNELSVGG